MVSPAVDTVALPDGSIGTRCTDRTHRSHSSDSRYDQCPWLDHAWREGRVEDSMGEAACVGSAVDAALTEAVAGRTAHIAGLLEAAIERMGDPRTRDMWDREPMLAKATALVQLGIERILPTYEAHGGVHATQLELHVDIDGVVYHVHIDAILGDGTIVDWKTREKRLADREAANSPQLSAYTHAVHAEYGHWAPAVILDAMVYANPPEDVRRADPTARKPWHDRQVGTRTEAQVAAWIDDFRRREAARSWMDRTGIHPTTGHTQMAFVCQGCAALSLCPSWAAYR